MRTFLFLIVGFILSSSLPSLARAGTATCRSTSHPKVWMKSWSKSGGAKPVPGSVVGTQVWYYGKQTIGVIRHYAGGYGGLGVRRGPKPKPPTIRVTRNYKSRRVLQSSNKNRMVTKQTYVIKATIKSLVRKRLHPKLSRGAVRLRLRCRSVQHHGIP